MLTGQAKWKEVMQGPISRNEAQMMEDRIYTHVLSTATAIEALDTLLTKKGILADNELLNAVAELLKTKSEQVSAAAESSNIVGV
jgi:hypothetical protein